MPAIDVAGGIRLHYEVDDHTDPWASPDAVLLLHGIAETGLAFRAWAPHLSRKYRVVRPDLRGFGRSGGLGRAPLEGVGIWADDMEALVQALGATRVHVVGAKLGALVAMELARRNPAWMKSMVLAGLLMSPKKVIGPWIPAWVEQIDRDGVESWARATMPGRMGALEPKAMAWWNLEMGAASAESIKACLRMVAEVDEPEGLERIGIPTLVMVASDGGEGGNFEQRQSIAAVDRFRRRFPVSELAPVKADSYHVAATHPDACAALARRFFDARS